MRVARLRLAADGGLLSLGQRVGLLQPLQKVQLVLLSEAWRQDAQELLERQEDGRGCGLLLLVLLLLGALGFFFFFRLVLARLVLCVRGGGNAV